MAVKYDGVIGLLAEWAGVARPSHWRVPPLCVCPLLDALVAELVEARVKKSLLRQSTRKAWGFPTLLVVLSAMPAPAGQHVAPWWHVVFLGDPEGWKDYTSPRRAVKR